MTDRGQQRLLCSQKLRRRSTSPVVPRSTIRPSFITTTVSLRFCTTPMSRDEYEGEVGRPSQIDEELEDLRPYCHVEGFGRGSSPMRMRGRARSRELTRCVVAARRRTRADNLVAGSGSSPTRASTSRTRASDDRRRCRGPSGSRTILPGGHARVEGGVGVPEDESRLSAQPPETRRGCRGVHAPSVDGHRPRCRSVEAQ